MTRKQTNGYLKLPKIEVLQEIFDIDVSSPSGLRWKSTNKFSKMRPGDIAGRQTHEGYWRVKVDHVAYTCHRIIYFMQTGEDPGIKMIDHISERQDNFNIRAATNAQNQANKKKKPGCTSRFKGVSFYKKHNKYKAGITVSGKGIHLGWFSNEIEAARAYNAAAKAHFGEFAVLNEVPGMEPGAPELDFGKRL